VFFSDVSGHAQAFDGDKLNEIPVVILDGLFLNLKFQVDKSFHRLHIAAHGLEPLQFFKVLLELLVLTLLSGRWFGSEGAGLILSLGNWHILFTRFNLLLQSAIQSSIAHQTNSTFIYTTDSLIFSSLNIKSNKTNTFRTKPIINKYKLKTKTSSHSLSIPSLNNHALLYQTPLCSITPIRLPKTQKTPSFNPIRSTQIISQ
jgi:hypothetical protein